MLIATHADLPRLPGQYFDGTTDVTRTWASAAIVMLEADYRGIVTALWNTVRRGKTRIHPSSSRSHRDRHCYCPHWDDW